MRNIKSLHIMMLLLFSMLLLAACQSGEKTEASNESQSRENDESIGVYEDKVVLGAHIGKSGPISLLATEFQLGWDAAVHEINKEGIHGRNLELIVENDEYTPAKAVAAVRKLIDREKVFAITGGGTPTVVPSLDYINQKQVPYLFPLAGQYERLNSVAGTEKARNLFMTHPDYAHQYFLLTRYIVEEMKLEKVAILYQNDDAGADMRRGINGALEKHGLKAVVEEGFESNTIDYTAQIQKAKNAGAEAVVLGSSVKQGALIMEQANSLGYNPQYFAHSTFNDTNFLELAGPLAEGMISGNFLIPEDSNTEKMQRFKNALKEVSPEAEPTFFNMYAYTTMMSIAQGLEEAGESPTRDKFIEALEGWKGKETELMDTLSFSKDNHDGIRSIYITKVTDGKWKKIQDEWLEMAKEDEAFIQ